MAISKTRLIKIVKAIETTRTKFYELQDLSVDTGIKIESLRKDLEEFLPLINFDYPYNLTEYCDVFKERLEELNKAPKKKKVYTKKDIDNYTGFVDYVYKNMTDYGGILDTGYVLNKKDIRIIRRLLKDEAQKIKEKEMKKMK